MANFVLLSATKVLVELTAVFWDHLPEDLQQDTLKALLTGQAKPGGMLEHLLDTFKATAVDTSLIDDVVLSKFTAEKPMSEQPVAAPHCPPAPTVECPPLPISKPFNLLLHISRFGRLKKKNKTDESNSMVVATSVQIACFSKCRLGQYAHTHQSNPRWVSPDLMRILSPPTFVRSN